MDICSDIHGPSLNLAYDGYTYLAKMRERGRAIVISGMDGPLAICTFFLLEHPMQMRQFYNKDIWEVVPDYPDGSILYIDKLLSTTWDLTIRKMVQTELLLKFPAVRAAVWFRPTKTRDRVYTYFRKGE